MNFIYKLLGLTKKTDQAKQNISEVERDALRTVAHEVESDVSGDFIAVVVQGRAPKEETHVFGPFNSAEEADMWEAGVRVSFKKMLAGEMSVMSGGTGILPATSIEALAYISKFGIISPDDKEWQVIR